MSPTEDLEASLARAQAVDEEYDKLDRFHIQRRRIVLLDNGRGRSGGYGVVRRAELHHSAYLPTWVASRQYGTPQLVAVKQIRISAFDDMSDFKRAFTKETLVWSGLKAHPGIAKFLGFYADLKLSEAWLISPWEPHGNISEFLLTRNLEVPEKLSLVYDTIDALSFLHQLDPPVCHGDIKSANILVNTKFKAVLCDFGLARIYEDCGFARLETSTKFRGSLRWCSPEVIDGGPRTPASDVYSWAWLVWEIMTGKLPYEGTSADYAIMRQIFESPLPQVDGESRLSDCLQVWELMTRCWESDPLQRPTANMCKTTVTYLPRCTSTHENADHPTRGAELLENLGDLERWKGNISESFRYLDEALRLYEGEGDTRGIASVLVKQADTSYRHSDYRKAQATATMALERYRNLEDALGAADASFWLGCSLYMQDESDKALPFLRESLGVYRTQGNDVGVVKCLERIGEIQRVNSQNTDALATMDEVITIASRSGDRLGVAKALMQIGITQWQLSNLVEATSAISEASTISRKIGSKAQLITSLEFIGRIKMEEGGFCKAEEPFQESISIARDSHNRWGIARGLEELGRCFRSQGKLHEAARSLEEACTLYQEMLRFRDSIRAASTLVELKTRQGELDSALFWYDRIIAMHRSQDNQMQVASNMEWKGEFWWGRNDTTRRHCTLKLPSLFKWSADTIVVGSGRD